MTHYYSNHGGGVEIVAGQLAARLADTFDITWCASDAAAMRSSVAAPVVRSAQKPAERLGDGPKAGPAAAPKEGPELRPIHCWNFLERRLGLPMPIPTLPAVLSVRKAVRGADAVWVHDLIYPANLVAVVTAAAAHKPFVVTAHVGAIPYRNRVVRWLMAVAVAVTGRLLLTRAAAVAFVSERVRDEFVARWRLPEPRLIANGVDLDVFRPLTPSQRDRVRTEFRVGNGPVVLFVGRFVERKGLRLLRELAVRMPSVRWLFAGQGPIDPAAWGLANVRVERDRFGRTLAELYGASDLLALPSVGEGFPLVVAEALAMGLPVLVDPSTVAGCRAVAAVAGSESVTDPDAAGRWAARIETLLADEAGRVDGAARRTEFARANWDWDRAAGAYRDLFGEVLRGRVAGRR